MVCSSFVFLSVRGPPLSTRSDTLCPYTTPFRAEDGAHGPPEGRRLQGRQGPVHPDQLVQGREHRQGVVQDAVVQGPLPRRGAEPAARPPEANERSEEHTSELQSLMSTSNAVFCVYNKNTKNNLSKCYETTN